MTTEIKGDFDGSRLRAGLVVARFNAVVTDRLEEGALDEPKGLGIQRSGQVDAVDFCAETAGQRANVDRSHARDFMPMAPARSSHYYTSGRFRRGFCGR